MRIVVLDSFAADQGDTHWTPLRALGQVVLHDRTTDPAQLAERSRDAEALITNKVALSAELIGSLSSLRYIGVSATGTNIIDLPAARARGVAVTNVPGYSTESVAQLAFALLLELTAGVSAHSQAVKAGRWAATPDFCFFLRPLPELVGKNLLIIGHGAIGQAVARIGRAFGMNVIVGAVPGSTTGGRTPLDQALPVADAITLHCPLTTETTGLVDATFLKLCKPSAVLINTSRGGLVNERDLVAALADNRIGGAGLDVLSQEPPPADHPLTDPRPPWASRVIVTPHIAWGTVEARDRLRQQVAENLRAFQAGQSLNRVV